MDRVMTLTEGLAFAIEQLDSIGFDIGSTRISIYRAGGIIVVVATTYVLVNVVIDMSYRLLDPRIEYE